MKVSVQAKRLMELQELLLRFLEIERLVYLPDRKHKDRSETDTEHSYHLAILGWYLSSAYPHLDRDKIIRYSLVHDLVEIYAGDVMAIGRTAETERIKEEKEVAALKRLQKEWPDFTDMTATIVEYEAQDNPEALFVKALDKLAPLLLQLLSKGKTWKMRDMDRKTVIAHKDKKTAKVPEIEAIWKVLREEVIKHDEYFNEGKR